MHMHEHHSPKEPVKVDASLGYEASDVRVSGIVVFLAALATFVAVVGVFSIGLGKVINSQIAKADGPVTKWNHPVDVRKLGNLASDPELQHQFAQLASRFPTPRLQTDDGYQEIYEMHQREDLLLDNYSWVDQGKGTVRIPIERAMELVAQKGLPVAPPQVRTQKLMAEESEPAVQVPLTNGFARTGYEQEVEAQNTSQNQAVAMAAKASHP